MLISYVRLDHTLYSINYGNNNNMCELPGICEWKKMYNIMYARVTLCVCVCVCQASNFCE